MSAVRRETTVTMRLSRADRDLIDAAAKHAGKSRTAYMVEAARRAAIDERLDRAHFVLSPEAWDAFAAILDRPPRANAGLADLLSRRAPWEA